MPGWVAAGNLEGLSQSGTVGLSLESFPERGARKGL